MAPDEIYWDLGSSSSSLDNQLSATQFVNGTDQNWENNVSIMLGVRNVFQPEGRIALWAMFGGLWIQKNKCPWQNRESDSKVMAGDEKFPQQDNAQQQQGRKYHAGALRTPCMPPPQKKFGNTSGCSEFVMHCKLKKIAFGGIGPFKTQEPCCDKIRF